MEKGAAGVNWQDELRKLDDELASGRISADDYRVRRDQVLSSSSVSGQQSPGQRWQVQPPSTGPASGSQATQYIAPVGGQGEQAAPNPDATQVVTPRPADSDRTQVVPGSGMAQPNYGPPSPPHGFQNQGTPPAAPPWVGAGDQAPPWVIQSNNSWGHSGPEVFDDTSSGKGKKVFAIIGVVLVVALIGGAVWWFGLREGSGGGGQTTAGATTTTSSSARPKTAIEKLPDAPGTPDANNGDTTPDKLVEGGFLSQEEVAALGTAGVSKVAFKSGKQDAFTYDVEVFETATPSAATALATALSEYSTSTGMVDGARGALPATAKVLQVIKPKNSGTYRAIYATGKQVVRITTTQEPIGDTDSEVIKKFQEFGIAVAKQFPVS